MIDGSLLHGENRGFQSEVFDSVQKMALRALYIYIDMLKLLLERTYDSKRPVFHNQNKYQMQQVICNFD